MDWRPMAVLAGMLLITGATGCLSSPEPPISKIPKVLIDYIEEEGVFSIYVHGTSECKYRNVRIYAEDTLVFNENYTFYGAYRTNETDFNITIEIAYQDEPDTEPVNYFYNASIELMPYGDSFFVSDIHGDNVVDVNKGPYIALMEREE